jgi:eukaryotic-like serine/threonine-protein kinase
VALKMILAGGHADAQELARFRIEAAAVARLRHRHIVHINDFGEHDGRPFVSLELVVGGTLDGRLKQGPLPPREAATIVEKLARAIGHAHERGIVHRDLKPTNVLLTEDGEPKVTDFGLAKRLDTEDGLSQSGAVLGTAAYPWIPAPTLNEVCSFRITGSQNFTAPETSPEANVLPSGASATA